MASAPIEAYSAGKSTGPMRVSHNRREEHYRCRFFSKGGLVIGVSDYEDPGLKLAKPITLADAKGVAEALHDPTVAAYPAGQVRLIPEQGTRATRVEVVKAFEQFAGQVKPDDTAFIFYCGHGVLGETGEYYLTTEDTVLNTHGRVKEGTGIAKLELLKLLTEVKAQKVLFIINACFSGHVGGTLSASASVARRRLRPR